MLSGRVPTPLPMSINRSGLALGKASFLASVASIVFDTADRDARTATTPRPHPLPSARSLGAATDGGPGWGGSVAS